LTIFAGILLLLVVTLLPETCRAVVGNGSVAPHKWNYPLKDALFLSRHSTPQYQTIATFKQRLSPWNTLKLVWDKEAACTILFGAVIYAGYLSITTTLPFKLGKHYGFNALQIGLCYLSYGGGSLTSRWTAGTLMNWNFRRFAPSCGT
jgi:predicted MFS family arabinose efflux permease